MFKCPSCGRKLNVDTTGAFEVPEHLNYMKTATCGGSGRRFGFTGHMAEDRPRSSNSRLAAIAACAALLYLDKS